MEPKRSDFAKMRFDVFQSKRMTEAHPELSWRKTFTELPSFDNEPRGVGIPDKNDLDKMLRFVILFCTRKENPLWKERDLDKKTNAILLLLGYEKLAWMKKMVNERHWWFLGLCAAYFKMVYDKPFEMWLSLKMNYHDMNAFLRRPLDYDDPDKVMSAKDKVRGNLKRAALDLEEQEESLFGSNGVAEMMSEFVTGDEIGGWAELFAQEFPYFQS